MLLQSVIPRFGGPGGLYLRAVRFPIHRIGYLLLTLIGVAVWYPQLVQRGMYNDGLWYAAIARNWSLTGNWWHPQLSETFGAFVPHPPLLFWLEGSWFWLFGDEPWIERGYSLVVLIATVMAMRWMWRTVVPTARAWWWVPVALWSLNEVAFNYYPNNLLDNTMGLFALGSVGFLLRQTVGPRALLGAGLCLVLAFLTKGPVALFPLAVPGMRWLLLRDSSLGQATKQTVSLLGTLALALGGLWLLSPAVRDFAAAYYDIQIRGGLAGEQVYHARDNRLYILWRLAAVLAPALLLTALTWLLHTRHLRATPPVRPAWLLFGIGLSASVPLVFSPKQTYYYLLAALPYFYLAFGAWLLPSLRQIRWSERIRRYVVVGLGLAIGVAAVRNLDSHERVRSRHRPIYADMQRLLPHLPEGATINSDEYFHTLLGYLARYRRVSVDTSAYRRSYFLTSHPGAVPPGYRLLPLNTERYRLYQKTD